MRHDVCMLVETLEFPVVHACHPCFLGKPWRTPVKCSWSLESIFAVSVKKILRNRPSFIRSELSRIIVTLSVIGRCWKFLFC